MRPRGVDAFGTTVAEQQQGESIETAPRHEAPDPTNAFADPCPTRTRQPLTIRTPSLRRTTLSAPMKRGIGASAARCPAEGGHEDTESDMVAVDAGINGGGSSADEAAMHIIDDEPR